MDDTISRQAAIDAVRDYLIGCQIEDGDYHADGIMYKLDRLPSVTERKKGQWIHDGYDFFPQGIDWIHCSVCGKRWINVPADLPKYCPCCGARMEGAEDAGRNE